MKSTTENQQHVVIPGYDYGRPAAAHSPLMLEELRQIEQTVGWSEADADALRRHQETFRDHAEAMVDSWRAIIGEQPHLVKWFFGPDGTRDAEYAARVKARFVQWVIDACVRPHDQAWLDYQEEIGLRHTPEKKNQTDHRQAPPLVPLRYLLAFIPVVADGVRKFLSASGVSGDELDRVARAWAKAVHLHVTLWTRPYTKEGMW
jgi:Protoglobin